MLEFEDVKNCKTIEELNEFRRKYLDKRDLKGEERKKDIMGSILYLERKPQ